VRGGDQHRVGGEVEGLPWSPPLPSELQLGCGHSARYGNVSGWDAGALGMDLGQTGDILTGMLMALLSPAAPW